MENVMKWLAEGNWINLTGYAASLFMFSTFYMSKMIPLRVAGIASNIVFIIYTACSYLILSRGIWPIFILHVCLLPMNIWRLKQMLKLVYNVKKSSSGDFNMDFLTPFMHKVSHKKGDVLFSKGDESDKLYYIQKGFVLIEGLDIRLAEGDVLGEMGIFSSDNKRSATVICGTDTDFYAITDSQVRQLYYQNPEFGFYLLQLILNRLLSLEKSRPKEKPA